MPAIEISEDQHDYLEELCEKLRKEHVDEYGTVRPRDALQFLIDRHEVGGTADRCAYITDDGTRCGNDAETGSDYCWLESHGPSAEVTRETDDDLDSGTNGETGDDGDDSDGDRLEAMMNLLDAHDDKWERDDGEEGRYAVTLPDGSIEHARTKDDVRALLFQHYR